MDVKYDTGSNSFGSFRLLDTPLKKLIEWFWKTSQAAPRYDYFANSFEALVKNYGRYHVWARLTLKEVLKKTEFGKTSIENFVKAITENISDNEVVKRFAREIIDKTIIDLESE
jgi:hypothetical protein